MKGPAKIREAYGSGGDCELDLEVKQACKTRSYAS